jgi:raffinose/stachyose/melibiose transport system substrate-binding protein
MTKKHWFRRPWLQVGVVGLLAMGLTVLSAGSASAAPAQTTLTLYSIATYQPGFEQVISDFEKAHPNIKIDPQYQVVSNTSTLNTEFAAGHGTDIVYMAPGNGGTSSVWPFARDGYLLNLSNASWANGMYQPTKPLYMYKGKVYAWDMGESSTLLSYNQDYFTAHNLTLPTTFDQLLTLCKTISAQGEIPISWGAASTAVNIGDLTSLAVSNVTFPQWLQQRSASKTTFQESAGWRNTVEEITKMNSAGCFQQGAAGLQLTQMITQFSSGKAAMLFTYAGLDAALMKEDPNLHIGMLVPPGPTEKSTRLSITSAGGLGIWSKSPNKAAAETFLNFISKPNESAEFAKLNVLISADQERSGQVPSYYSQVEPYYKQQRTTSTPVWQFPNLEMANTAGAQVTGLFTGQTTVDQLLADLDQDWTSGG